MRLRTERVSKTLIFIGMVSLFLSYSYSVKGSSNQDDISIGTTVKVDTRSNQRLNLRVEPGTNFEIVANLENGTLLTIIDGPIAEDGFDWWKVDGEYGTGWIVANYLEVVDSGIQSLDNETVSEILSDLVTTSIANSYGFSGCYVKKDSDFPYFYIDIGVTYNQVKWASDLLGKAGYTSTAHENNTANEAIQTIPGDDIFFFYGHGYYAGLLFHDDKCNNSFLLSKNVEDIESPNLKLAVLLGCKTGEKIDDPGNIMRAFQTAGSKKVIGFSDVIDLLAANHWNNSFWTYAIDDRMEVGSAAMKAANDQIWGMYWLSPNNLVILGDEEVYLIPRVDDREEDLADDILKYFEALYENIKIEWDNIVAEGERRLLEILVTQFQIYLERLYQLLFEYLYQCCFGPLGIGIAAGISILRCREKLT